VGLLAGHNDLALLETTGVGRDINRHYYTPQELGLELARPVVRKLCALIRLRNTHPAFQGSFSLGAGNASSLCLRWTLGAETAELYVDFRDDSGHLHVTAEGALHSIDLLEDH
jgi:sucrose phosphorylase